MEKSLYTISKLLVKWFGSFLRMNFSFSLFGKAYLKGILFIMILGLAISSHAQDFAKLTSKDAKFSDFLKAGGGLSYQATYYKPFGVEANRDPLVWQLNLNLNLNLLGFISAPFSFSYSSLAQSNFQSPQPFNTFGISPTYKAFTLHLGYRSLNLSEFSLSGSQFFGVGLEVTPSNLPVKGKAVYGRFARPIYFNPNGTVATAPSFQRLGWGTSVTGGNQETGEVTLILFKAKDDPFSLGIHPDSLEIKPADNLVFGLGLKKQLTSRLSYEGEIDYSLYTEDHEGGEDITSGDSYLNNIPLFKFNSTSQAKKAIVSSLNYKLEKIDFQLKYRRVDPEYKTLGIAFVNNDYEDVALGTNFGILGGKVTVGLSGGVQRNNLEKSKATQMNRFIHAANVNYTINDSWNMALNYSNFSASTRQTIVITFDSLRMVQTTKSAGVNVSKSIKGEKFAGGLSFGINYQDAIVNDLKTTTMVNGNFGFQGQFPGIKLSSGLSLIAMQNITEMGSSSNIGPSWNISRPLLKDKIQLSCSITHLPTYFEGDFSGSISNIGISGSTTIAKKNNLAFTAGEIFRTLPDSKSRELTVNFSYSYSF